MRTTSALARSADLFLISAGELTETAFLRVQDMLSAEELREIRARGAVCDTLGRLFDRMGQEALALQAMLAQDAAAV